MRSTSKDSNELSRKSVSGAIQQHQQQHQQQLQKGSASPPEVSTPARQPQVVPAQLMDKVYGNGARQPHTPTPPATGGPAKNLRRTSMEVSMQGQGVGGVVYRHSYCLSATG